MVSRAFARERETRLIKCSSERILRRLPPKDLKILKRRIRSAKRRIAAKEFRRLCEMHTHCPTCGVDTKMDPSHIDWEEVRSYPSDPCGDWCAAATTHCTPALVDRALCLRSCCGGRKNYPGESHC